MSAFGTSFLEPKAFENFKDYLLNEFKIDGVTSVLIKPTHSLNVKIDKQSKKMLNNHTISVSINLYDKDLHLLKKDNIKFVNNELTKKDADRLVNISPKELTNRFNFAKKDITKMIYNDLVEKMNAINDKINALNLYEDLKDKNDAIPSEFKGELIQLSKEKQKFDM